MDYRNLYLDMKPVEEAQSIFMSAIMEKHVQKTEIIKTVDAAGRVTAEAVFAKYSSPMFNASAMDGIAVISSHTSGASTTHPLVLQENFDFIVVDTGDPVHAPYDAVIMAEDTVETPEGIRIVESIAPWENIRPIGEDIVAGEMIISGHHRLRPIDIGVLLSAGITEIPVLEKPTVAIFPTGTEIIEPTDEPVEGSIIESNSRMFESLVNLQGGTGVRYPILKDSYDEIRDKVSDAISRHDMVIINAGSSAGREDYTVHVLRELGEVLVHGVAIKPGKPVILAMVQGKPVIGLPGYPVSAYVGFVNFVAPVLAFLTELPESKPPVVPAVMTRRLVSSLKHKEYVRVKVGEVGARIIAAPLTRGAGAAMSLVRADGFCIIEQNSEGVEAGETVPIMLTADPAAISRTLVVIGSHDMMLDVLADMLPVQYKDIHLSSTHVGSLGGIMALQRKETHLAPIHLLDEETGTYNLPFLKSHFKEPMALIKGVGRIQGIMVKKGNPLNINSFEDLKHHRFVNRQRGAGTRMLFDFELKKRHIRPEEINGYDLEATTHMAVAALVGSDGADAGLGILAAAKAMDLDFIPVGQEDYDFALSAEHLDLPYVQAFIDLLKSDLFRQKMMALGGYSFDSVGEIQLVNGF
jgi:putative molybdopterin biosynthesis protein